MRKPLIARTLTLTFAAALATPLGVLAQPAPIAPATAASAADVAAAAASAAAPAIDAAAAPAADGASAAAVAADAAQIESARVAGTAWLALADSGDYAGAWTSAGALLRATVSEAQLVTALKAAREPLGALTQRTPETARTLISGPGMPTGQYVLFTFIPQFANKASASERMTVQRETDGRWRVIGYYVE